MGIDVKVRSRNDGCHVHAIAAGSDWRWLNLAMILLGLFMAGEVIVGLASGSLALLSDAAHMLTDVASIALALAAMRLAVRPPKGGYTYGLKRAEILATQANGLALLLLAGWLGYEAISRLVDPLPVAGGLVLITALVGMVVNAATTWVISRANRANLNVEGAYQHILTDLFAFIATAIAGVVMVFTGFARADAIATLVVVALMIKAGVRLMRASGRILLEAAPVGVDPAELGARLAGIDGVVELHDLHVWQITSGQPALSAHVLVAEGGACHAVRRAMESLLRAEYAITHTTLQVDHVEAIVTVNESDPHCADARGLAPRTAAL
ncbi:MAG: cation diffusion facilitator family transporter [Mycobacteriales bacterium]